MIWSMAHRIVILGGGTGGTLTANRLHHHYGDMAEIVVVDRDDRHVYQPGLLFVPLGSPIRTGSCARAASNSTTGSNSGWPRSTAWNWTPTSCT
jgi:NADH dehydrogenase FAD-containing subunit